MGPLMGMTGGSGVALFFKSFLALLAIPAALVAAGFGLRRLLGSTENLAADLFVAGAALSPVGLSLLLGGLLGRANAEVALLLFFFAATYLVLMLYGGLTGVGKLTPKAAAPAVPVLLLLAAWLTKVLFAALL